MKNRLQKLSIQLSIGLKPGLFLVAIVFFLFSAGANAQMTMQDHLRQIFSNYVSDNPREEIYIHTDRDEYISGEDMWFSTYLIDRQSMKPSSSSSIVYFELLNPENRPVLQRRIGLKDGFGPGQIILPDTLTSGTYTIRAYTNWMRNFLPYNCFMKDIKIYNALSNKKFTDHKQTSARVYLNTPATLSNVSLDNSIGFTVNRKLPGILSLIISTNQKYRSTNNNLFYLFIQTHGIADLVRAELLTGDTTSIAIPDNMLSPGINQITLFDLRGFPVCERYVYTPSGTNNEMSVRSDDSTGIRKKVSLEIDMKLIDKASNSNSQLSISVSPVEDYRSGTGLNSFLLLGSEFGILKADPVKNKDISDLSGHRVDSILATVHSNWIDWQKMVLQEVNKPVHGFETDKQVLSGTLLGGSAGNSVSDKYIFLSVPGKIPVFQYARTDSDGNFSFRLHVDESVNDLIIQPEKAEQNQNIKIESSFSDNFLKQVNLTDTVSTRIPTYIADWSAAYQVRKIYGTVSTGPALPPFSAPLIHKRFYGKPDVEIKLEDYIKLPVMQEVFFELITGAFLKEKKSDFEITIADPVDNRIYDNPPVLMIDGVIIKDPAEIANLDPELVEEIDVERERYMVGEYLFYGIVNVITIAGDFSNGNLPPEAVRIPYRVLDPVLSYVSPDYSTGGSGGDHIPDFRTTLYWNPSLTPGKEGKTVCQFWTSDLTGSYRVNIQGFSSDGKPVSFTRIIKVR